MTDEQPQTEEEASIERITAQMMAFPVDPGNPYLLMVPVAMMLTGPVDTSKGKRMVATFRIGPSTVTGYLDRDTMITWSNNLRESAGELPTETGLQAPAGPRLLGPGGTPL